MSNSLKRAHLRMQGVDIEVTALGESTDGIWQKTGKYRYTISLWRTDGRLIKNIYSSEVYDSYDEAENTAIHIAKLELAKL